MLSEKTYWAILIVTFTGFALIIWLLFIPYGMLEYNLGVNLFTSSVFMVLTIIFLTWFVTLRDRNRWKTVEDEIYESIQNSLSNVFDYIYLLTKGNFLSEAVMNIEDKENRRKIVVIELSNLKNEEIDIQPESLQEFLLLDRDFMRLFGVARISIHNTQIKYSRFLDPQLTRALFKIEQSLHTLEALSYVDKIRHRTHTRLKALKEENEKETKKMLGIDRKTIRELIGLDKVQQKPELSEGFPKKVYSKVASYELKELINQIDCLQNIWIEYFVDKYLELEKKILT